MVPCRETLDLGKSHTHDFLVDSVGRGVGIGIKAKARVCIHFTNISIARVAYLFGGI